ncbi:HalOD1 output domain-containing protein [Haloarchaeobius sp. HRN-SO-5]|uniref:HalOD1 output domain-containing protein n=1 Tax=Haloarchaeobius sp. HRN-SO-5 TaxID=3446118 RepID=UPI003EBEA3C2
MIHTELVEDPSSCAAERIVTAVAEAENADPVEMTPPLNDVVDTDALNRLVDPESNADPDGLELRFTYRGHDVVVSGDGEVEVR